jgi:hypothetical protein
MGLVGRANENDAGEAGVVDMAATIRQAVATEIERQRLQSLRRDGGQDDDPPDEH